LISSVPISKKLFIGQYLNGHVSSIRVGFVGMHGRFGYRSRNQEGEGVLNFALAYDLIVCNTIPLEAVNTIAKSISSYREERIDTLA
jgi:hypothetical protein